MGIFDRFKKQNPAPETPSVPEQSARSPGSTLVEIARVISNGDETVLREAAACAERPADWFAEHQDQYEERGVDSADDTDLVQWLGLVDILEGRNWVCERDWKDELEDFLFFLQKLKGFQALQLTLDPAWFDPDGDISAWCGILTEKWEGVRVAAIDIDSDSYVLFPASTAQLADLQRLAGEIGHRIDYAEQM